jgi:hypothetical protein
LVGILRMLLRSPDPSLALPRVYKEAFSTLVALTAL